VRRFHNRKSISEIAERLEVKITYIKHRIHALNIVPYRAAKPPAINKRPYKDYVRYNYAKNFEDTIAHIKFVYSDPDIPFSEWINYDEVEAHILTLLTQAGIPAFVCDYKPIECKQKRKDGYRI